MTYPGQPDISAIYKLGSISFTDIASGPNCACEEPENFIIDSQAEYDAVSTQCNLHLSAPGSSSNTKTPDFSVQECAAMIHGTSGYFGDALEIIAIEQTKDSVIVHSVLWTTPPGTFVLTSTGAPWDIVAFNKVSKPITFAPIVGTDEPRSDFNLPSPL